MSIELPPGPPIAKREMRIPQKEKQRNGVNERESEREFCTLSSVSSISSRRSVHPAAVQESPSPPERRLSAPNSKRFVRLSLSPSLSARERTSHCAAITDSAAALSLSLTPSSSSSSSSSSFLPIGGGRVPDVGRRSSCAARCRRRWRWRCRAPPSLS